jgi:hypothetical protein
MSVDLTLACGRENRTNAHIINSNCRLIHEAVSFLRWAFPLSFVSIRRGFFHGDRRAIGQSRILIRRLRYGYVFHASESKGAPFY